MISTDKIKRTFRGMFIVAVAVLILSGCISGGSLNLGKASGYNKTLVSYRLEHGGSNVNYCLVETEKGLAFLEQEQGGNSTLANLHWRDSDGDHFAVWISFLSRQGGAVEYIIPFDRTQPAKRFHYPVGSYTIIDMNGIERPIAVDPARQSPVRLIPVTDHSDIERQGSE